MALCAGAGQRNGRGASPRLLPSSERDEQGRPGWGSQEEEDGVSQACGKLEVLEAHHGLGGGPWQRPQNIWLIISHNLKGKMLIDKFRTAFT